MKKGLKSTLVPWMLLSIVGMLVCFGTIISCKKENKDVVIAAPTITVTADTTTYHWQDTVLIKVDVDAPGKLKELKIGSVTITTFSNDQSIKGITAKYVIALDAPTGELKVEVSATDQQNPSKTTKVNAIVKVGQPKIAKTICDYTLDETALTTAGWTKVFEDEFSTDLSKWNTWIGGAFNNELELYQASNVSIVNGNLLISAKRETVSGPNNPYDATSKSFNFTSGRIECKTNFSASSATPKIRIAARIKWPNSTGLWPGFWSFGDPWPTMGEIDILECRGQAPTKFQTNYFYGTVANTNLVQDAAWQVTAESSLCTCFHVYELVWEQNKLTYYLDGKVFEVKTSGGYIDQLFGKSERIVLNMAVGGSFFSNLDPVTIQEGTMEVDYVKVFTSN